jgi:DNA-directed RNA polymerase omega subunit
MELDATERLVRACSNRYEAVLLVAKHARRLNMERLREKSDEEEIDEPQEKQKIIIQALQNVLEGKVEFERPKRT